jgi:hypothetical protein
MENERKKKRRNQTKYLIVAKSFDKRGRLIATATNSYTKTHPLQLHFAKLAGKPGHDRLHAEIQCLLRSRDRSIDTLVIERYDSEGQPALARPCVICQGAIRAFNVRFINYTDDGGFVKEKM